MKPGLRKLVLTSHIVFSVGWLGAVAAYLALAIVSFTGVDTQKIRSAYFAMELIGWFVIVPLSLASLLTGLIQSLGTAWGLFRHYWILTKFILTVVATAILLVHMQTVSRVAGTALGTDLLSVDLLPQRIQLLVHSGGGLLVLITITVLSVYKPWGMTGYGQRKAREKKSNEA